MTNAKAKTYWHLRATQRIPNDYEVVSSQLAYHPRLGSAVQTPVRAFALQHASRLPITDWDMLRDPRGTTYASYVSSRRDRELFADQLLQVCDHGSYDAALSPRWLDLLEATLAPLRYPCHALQLMAAYLGSAAPSGTLAVMASFQAADELRRIARFAYRTKQLMLAHRGFAADAKQRWLNDPRFQPLRELLEHMLITYDYDEAYCALNLVCKPMFDELFGAQLARLALAQGDDVLGRLLFSLYEDQRWHRDSAICFAHFVAERGHAAELGASLARWQPRVLHALTTAAELFHPLAARETLRDGFSGAYLHGLARAGLRELAVDMDEARSS